MHRIVSSGGPRQSGKIGTIRIFEGDCFGQGAQLGVVLLRARGRGLPGSDLRGRGIRRLKFNTR